MKILHVAPAFFPATYWGGPIYSLASLCRTLASGGTEVRVLTTDSAGPRISNRVRLTSDYAPLGPDVAICYCRRLAGASVSPGLLARLLPLVRWADVVHLTAVYSFPTIPTILACRVSRKPLVWSPRGSLQVWSRSSNLRLKSVWNALCRGLVRGLPLAMHVTSREELEESRARMPGLRHAMIPNGVAIPERLPARSWQPGGRLRLLFLGRLDPKKGIENLLAALPLVKHGNVDLTIRGDGEARYTASLRRLVEELSLQQRVRFTGHSDEAAKLAGFMEADACIVPSHTENFGMVVAESLAHAVPVIASTGTPWRELRDRGCGLWVNNSPEQLAAAIDEIAGCDLEDLGLRGREWMQREYKWEAIAARTFELYREMAAVAAGKVSHHHQ